MSIPNVKTIKQMRALEELRETHFNEDAEIIKQAMVWANEGEMGEELEDYIEAYLGEVRRDVRGDVELSHYERVQIAFQVIERLLSAVTEGVVDLKNTSGGGVIYLDVAMLGVETIIYDKRTRNWMMASVKDVVYDNILGYTGTWYGYRE